MGLILFSCFCSRECFFQSGGFSVEDRIASFSLLRETWFLRLIREVLVNCFLTEFVFVRGVHVFLLERFSCLC